MNTWQGKIILSLLALVSTGATGYWTALQAIGDRERALLQRIAVIETRQEEQYKALHQRLDDLKIDVRGVGSDINQTRDEIMRILRGMR